MSVCRWGSEDHSYKIGFFKLFKLIFACDWASRMHEKVSKNHDFCMRLKRSHAKIRFLHAVALVAWKDRHLCRRFRACGWPNRMRKSVSPVCKKGFCSSVTLRQVVWPLCGNLLLVAVSIAHGLYFGKICSGNIYLYTNLQTRLWTIGSKISILDLLVTFYVTTPAPALYILHLHQLVFPLPTMVHI